MKKINLILLAVILIISGCGKKQSDETTRLGFWTDYFMLPATLKGKVKEMKELNYWAVEKDGQTVKGEILTAADFKTIGMVPNFSVSFDESGNVTRYAQLDGEKEIFVNTDIIENDRITREEKRINDTLVYNTSAEYNSDGRLGTVKVFRAFADTLLQTVIFSYDAGGNPVKLEYLNYAGLRKGYHECTPDNEGKYLEVKYFNSKDSLEFVTKNIYNEVGFLVSQEALETKTGLITRWDYENLKNDEKGNLIVYLSNVENGKYKLYTERTIVYY